MGTPGLSKTGTASGSSSPTTSATTTTPSCWAAAPGCSAPRRGGSRPRRSTWPANTASRRARPWPTGRSPTTISSPTTTSWSGRWAWPACPATPATDPDPRGYPLPPFPLDRSGEMLAAAADSLGWTTAPVPMLVNSRPYGGRPGCVNCGQCVGHPCPVDAKNGSHNALLPRAAAAGADILCDTQAARVDDVRGEVDLRSERGQRTVRGRPDRSGRRSGGNGPAAAVERAGQ